jgi:tetratricopeptide (TPR) repeat protein
MSAPPTEAGTEVVDRDNPWPGLESFNEQMAGLFHGRGEETEELFQLIKRGILTVLFGQSGLGKSSLLKAGLFPLLRSSGFLPVLIRLNYGEDFPTLAEQIRQTLGATLADQGEGVEAPQPRADQSLWEYFHRADVDFWNSRNRLVTPVLVFDQFEEYFYQADASEETRRRGRDFLQQLSELVENRAPQAVLEALDRNPEAAAGFDFDKQTVKVVLALREDFLANLEDLKGQLHPVMQNRMRLLQLHGPRALEAVLGSGGHLLDAGVGRQIVEFVAGRSGPSATDEEFEALTVEPALLSVVCRELNNSRIQMRLDKISAGLLSGTRTQILEKFYERSLAGVPRGVQLFIEDALLTSSGNHRQTAALEDACLIPGVGRAELDLLVKRRLLRYDERFGVAQVELIHDLLTEVVKQKRDSRRQEEALAREQRRSQEIKARLRRMQRWAAVCAALAVAALIALGWGAKQRAGLQEEQGKLKDTNRKLETANGKLETANGKLKKANEDLEREKANVAAAQGVIMETMGDLKIRNKKLNDMSGLLQKSLARVTRANMEAMEAKQGVTTALNSSGELIYAMVTDLYAKLSGIDKTALLNDSTDKISRFYSRITDVLAIADPSDEFMETEFNTLLYIGGVQSNSKGNLIEAASNFTLADTLAQRMADKHPADRKWRLYQAFASAELGDVHGKRMERSKALACFKKSEKTYDEVAVEPGDGIYSTARNKEIQLYELLGDYYATSEFSTALAYYNKSYQKTSELQKADPEDQDVKATLSGILMKLGSVEQKLDLLDDALTHYQASSDLLDQLIKDKPNNVDLQWTRTSLDNELGDLFRDYGRQREANWYYLKMNNTWRKLVDDDPADTSKQRNLAVTYERLGDAHLAMGFKNEARDNYEYAVSMVKALVKADSSNAEWRQDLASLYVKQGDLLMALQQDQEAEKSYYDGDTIYAELLEADPENHEVQQALAGVYEREGDVLMIAGRPAEARRKYEMEIGYAEALAAEEKGDLTNQILHSIGHTKVGSTYLMDRTYPSALRCFQEGREIREKLVEKHARKMPLLRDLVISYHKIGTAQRDGGGAGAEDSFQSMLGGLRTLAGHDPRNAGWLWDSLMTYARYGDFEQVLDQSITMVPEEHRFFNLKGIVCRTKGNSVQSLAATTRAIELARNSPEDRGLLAVYLLNRASYYKDLEQGELADADLREAVAADPKIEIPSYLKNAPTPELDKAQE